MIFRQNQPRATRLISSTLKFHSTRRAARIRNPVSPAMKLYRSRKVKYYYFPVTLSAPLLPAPQNSFLHRRRWKIILEWLRAKQWADDGISTTYISSERLIFKYDGLKIEPAFTLIPLIGTRFPLRVFSRTKKPARRHPPRFAVVLRLFETRSSPVSYAP